MVDAEQGETFEEFKDSFSYGSRNDLNFKFLKGLSDAEAGQFFQELLHKLADSADDGAVDRLSDHVVRWQARAYQGAAANWIYDEGPFTRMDRSVATARVGLLTSSGHFVAGQDPQPFGLREMSQPEAAARVGEFLRLEPELSAIPFDTPLDRLRVRHPGYDIRPSQVDANVSLPIDRFRELAAAGHVGSLPADAYSFVGACAQTRLLRHAGPRWVDRIAAQSIDAMVLVPV